MVRGSLENEDPATMRRRVGGKRTIPTVPFALSDNVDSVSVLDSTPEAGMPGALELSEGDTKKRRVESAWLTNSSDERKIFEIDVGDPLESEKPSVEIHPCGCQRDCQINRLRSPITVSGQQLHFDEAVTKELSQVLAADAVRRLSQEQELNLAHAVGSYVEVHRM